MVASLGLLSVFKYAGWLSNDLAALLALSGVTIATISTALPPAISFYTFQLMIYTIDIYRREFHPYRNVVDDVSFVSFFPHLFAGPIMRARRPAVAGVQIPGQVVAGTIAVMIDFKKGAVPDRGCVRWQRL